jgi:preprotein translocase subunit SecA
VATPQGLAEFAQAAAAKAEEGAVATKERPAPTGLHAKGIDNEPPPMTYSGPSEDGSTEVKRTGGGGGAGGQSAPTSRRERREAARQQARETKRRG